MSTRPDSAEAEARLDDLRRRLYRADATEDDLQRYVEERGAIPDATPPAEAPPPLPRRGRRIGSALVAALVAGVVLAGVVRTVQDAAPSSVPTPAPSRPRADSLVTVDADRVSTPILVPVSIRGTRVVGQRFLGSGSAVVGFDPPEGTSDGGRAQILLTTAEPAGVSWRAVLVMTRNDWSSYPLVLARGAAADHSGTDAPTTFVYPSRPPTRIAVQAPEGVGWSLIVGVTDRIAPERP